MLTVLDEGTLDLVGGLETERNLDPVADAADIELRDRSTLAGMDVLGGHNDSEFAVDFDDIAFAQ
jgi:transcriptional regulator with AAA-type ATPase domain